MKHMLLIHKQTRKLLTLLTMMMLFAPHAHADVPAYNPIHAQDIPTLVNNIVKGILGIVGALALFMFIYGGMLWLTSGGNSARIDKGKETLIWASIGLFVIFASYAILQFIFSALTGSAS